MKVGGVEYHAHRLKDAAEQVQVIAQKLVVSQGLTALAAAVRQRELSMPSYTAAGRSWLWGGCALAVGNCCGYVAASAWLMHTCRRTCETPGSSCISALSQLRNLCTHSCAFLQEKGMELRAEERMDGDRRVYGRPSAGDHLLQLQVGLTAGHAQLVGALGSGTILWYVHV